MESQPLPSKKKKSKKRKRSAKKSHLSSCDGTTDGDIRAKSHGAEGSSSAGNETDRKSPDTKTTNDDAKNMKLRPGEYPYPTDYNDHFETPARAYDDIFPLLLECIGKKQNNGPQGKKKGKKKAAKQPQDDGQGKSNHETTIYDPYYCQGRAAIHLNDVFERHKSNMTVSTTVNIQHEKRDFYRDIRRNDVPHHDILITNPPYSGGHKERCLEFAVKQLKEHGRPFFLLMPNYVAMKEYFRTTVLEDTDGSKKVQTFFVTPSAEHPYEYDHPEGTGHETSPFASVWFCGLSYKEGNKEESKSVMDAFAKFHSARGLSTTGTPRIAGNLQNLIRMGAVSAERRKNPRQRRKMKQQAMQRANAAAMGRGGAGANDVDDNMQQNKRMPGGHVAEHARKEGGYKKKRRRK